MAWHIFTLVMRWLTGVGVFWTLGLLWPGARRQAELVAVVFVTYPVFKQQAVALTFHQQWLQYALFILSLGSMILAVRNPRRRLPFTVLALVASALQLTVTEYFVGLELIRPVVLYILHGQQLVSRRSRMMTAFKTYLPYLLLTGAYVIWRLFFIQLTGDDPYRADTLYSFFSNPVGTLSYLISTAFSDSESIFSWPLMRDLFQTGDSPRFIALAVTAGSLVAAACIFFFHHLKTTELDAQAEHAAWTRQALALGLFSFLVGMIPAWITGREVLEDFHGDRYALPAMFGASLLVVMLIEWFMRRRLQVAVAVGLLVGVAVSSHILVSNSYRWIWASQTRFYWQLAWRAPYIQPNTAVLVERELFPNQGLFSISAALNLLYPQQDPRGEHLAYWMYTLLPRFANNIPQPLEVGFNTRFRTLSFEGATPRSLVIYSDPSRSNCLWVLTPRDRLNPDLSELVRSFVPVSNLDRIQSSSPSTGYPPETMFGPEPAREWCYLFEKAELAGQYGDWDHAAVLGDEAIELGYTPHRSSSNSPREWLPFIEAYARAGQIDQARQLTRGILDGSDRYRPMVCSLWEEIGAGSSAGERDVILEEIDCSSAHLNPGG